MKKTIFTTPIVSPVLRLLSVVVLKLIGWTVVGGPPADKKIVLIGAPHTSNWDFPMMLMAVFVLRMDVHWMGKASLFNFPFGPLTCWLGGIAIDRSKSNNMVENIVQEFNAHDALVVLNSPEGTRAKVERWKSGFYHIATSAGLRIALGYIDVSRRQMGMDTLFQPSGDVDADLIVIRRFYDDKQAIHPERF